MEPEQTPVAPQESEAHAALMRRVADNIGGAVQVRADTLQHLLVALLAEGHVLIEAYPGVGKTALARALARSIDCQFARVQCTSDLLPADVVGTNVYDQREQRFAFRPGPVFANVVLVDEINRASPKTQSGLLECMQERRVTVDVHTHELARPFLVLATQNPIEYEGTYPLPEAQVDRFMVRISLGYPTPDAESGMLADHQAGDRVLSLTPVAHAGEILAGQEAAAQVHASPALRDYVVRLLWRTREDPRVDLGASPGQGCCCSKRPRRTPCSGDVTMLFPTTCRPWPNPCWPIGWCWLRARCATKPRTRSRSPNRGRVSLRCPSLRLRDQLGLAEWVRPGSGGAQELLVLPRTERISWRQNAARALTDSNGGALSPEPTGAVEPEGLRQYRPGTPASRIHWPALARGAGLLERRLLADGESSPLVVLDARSPSSSTLLDAAVRAVASLTLELAGREGCD